MVFAPLIHHKTPTIGVWPLKRLRAEYMPVLGSTPSIPNLSVEVPENSTDSIIPYSSIHPAQHKYAATGYTHTTCMIMSTEQKKTPSTSCSTTHSQSPPKT